MINDNGINIRTALIFWLLTAGYMGIVFYLSSRSGFNLPRLPENFDKVIHVCIYIPLAFLFSISFKKIGLRKYVFVAAFVSATLYGVTDEIHQFFVAGRDASVGDIIADLAGALLGSFGGAFLKT